MEPAAVVGRLGTAVEAGTAEEEGGVGGGRVEGPCCKRVVDGLNGATSYVRAPMESFLAETAVLSKEAPSSLDADHTANTRSRSFKKRGGRNIRMPRAASQASSSEREVEEADAPTEEQFEFKKHFAVASEPEQRCSTLSSNDDMASRRYQ